MTDRFSSLTVVLEHDIREDDASALIQAIQLLRGVLTVEGNVVDVTSIVAEQRARHELREQLLAVVFPEKKD